MHRPPLTRVLPALFALTFVLGLHATAAPLAMHLEDDPLPPSNAGHWWVVANHTHTRASHDSQLPLEQLAHEAEALGIDALVLTDHNSMGAVTDPAYTAPRAVTLIPGEEWSSRTAGHAGLIGLAGATALGSELPVADMLRATRDRGGFAVINHPFLWNLGWTSQQIEDGFQGVEIWNNFFGMPLMSNAQSLAWWQDGLVAGRKLVGLGGADYHGGMLSGLTRPVNLVWATSQASDSLVASMRQGHVVVTDAPETLRVDMEAREARIGDTLHLDGPCEVPVRIRITGGAGLILRLVGPAGTLAEVGVTAGDQTFGATMPLGVGRSFVRAEVLRPRAVLNGVAALGNPLYFEVFDPQ